MSLGRLKAMGEDGVLFLPCWGLTLGRGGLYFRAAGRPLRHTFGLWNASSVLSNVLTHAPWLLAEPLIPSPKAT